jgi:hypothetical protein
VQGERRRSVGHGGERHEGYEHHSTTAAQEPPNPARAGEA